MTPSAEPEADQRTVRNLRTVLEEPLASFGPEIAADPGVVVHHLRDACPGSVSEILEGDAPHRPVGCVAQAWGVAETLRVWRALAESGPA